MIEAVSFFMQVAGIRFDVRCQYPTTKAYCADYLTKCDHPVQETIVITASDIDGERSRLLSKKNPGQPLEASTPQSLEVLVLCRRIADILPKYDRILFHGSSLAIDGNVVLFTAKSGTGKSTHTSLWRKVFGDRVRMVNDDKPFLEVTEEAVVIHGPPWRGKHALGANLSAPLKANVFVTRSQENRVEPISPRELFPLLLQQTYSPEDPAAMAQTLAIVERLSRKVQLLKLGCNMDPEAAEVAFRGINFEG